MTIEQKIVDVLYLDYVLYKIVDAYNKTIYQKLKKSEKQIKDPNLLPDILFYKNIASLIKNSLDVKYDEEVYKKILYVRVLQILDKNSLNPLKAITEVNLYLKTLEKKVFVSGMKYFTGCDTSPVLDWLNDIYKSFDVPYLFKECVKLIE
ncbi:hypothetical protein AAJ76_500075064 [Vairimorpha ceranae]|uniref:Uncharacterized protein n=1 Tax=Vairimorpha ceranae TaxID=40302 RepID=A0A0F9WI33_9MICR|nr:hypothetical protein AAJ76_500075064 [Vairimorpha ceranae]KKO76250.1 hypothetical protein AAJ76_500075064 [Vairimorpha ceranae]